MQVAEALQSLSIPFGSFDILEDEAVRQVRRGDASGCLELGSSRREQFMPFRVWVMEGEAGVHLVTRSYGKYMQL
jgi:hypothetical protein